MFTHLNTYMLKYALLIFYDKIKLFLKKRTVIIPPLELRHLW